MNKEQKERLKKVIRPLISEVKRELKEDSSENITDLLLQMLKSFDGFTDKIRRSKENQTITNKLVNIRADLYRLYLQSDKSA